MRGSLCVVDLILLITSHIEGTALHHHARNSFTPALKKTDLGKYITHLILTKLKLLSQQNQLKQSPIKEKKKWDLNFALTLKSFIIINKLFVGVFSQVSLHLTYFSCSHYWWM